MKTFLENLIDNINEEFEDISTVNVILPSKRSCLFFKERLIQSGLRSAWLPNVLTLNEFIEDLFPGQIQNKISLLSELFIIANKMKLEEASTFDVFYPWGVVLLNDFNTIESYGVEGTDLYKNLRDIEKLERWSFSNDPLSENQLAFNDFWMKQGELYKEFTHQLRKKDMASSGMALRWLVDHFDSFYDRFSSTHFIIAGFNALSLSEQKLIDQLLKIGNSQYLPDIDAFFVQGKREAGHFYRQLIKKHHWKGLKSLNNTFSTDNKKLEMISVTQRSAMALVSAQILNKLNEYTNVALVLGDESLLEPILSGLPENIGPINITMGYKLRNTPVYDLFLSLYSIQLRIKKKNNEIYHKDLNRFLNHPYISLLYGEELISKLKESVLSRNLIYINEDHVREIVSEEGHQRLLNNFLFTQWKKFPTDPTRQLLSFTDSIREVLTGDKHQLSQEYLFHFKKLINQLSGHIESYNFILGLKSYKLLFSELLKSYSISFQGEPLEGLQIMGLLETRTLDFEHIILVGVNEGNIPKTSTPQSFIPWDLKAYFGLPGRKEQDALYAYYFYRLIQRAKKVSFIYNTHSGKDLKSVEASRYLRQLNYYNDRDLTQFSIEKYQTRLDYLPHSVSEIKVERNSFYKQKLIERLEKGLSPTGLASYLNCPLDYYFKYILGLKDKDEIDEELGADVFGKIVHEVLEKLYIPFVGGVPDFKLIENNLDLVLTEVVKDLMKNRWVKTGKNQLNIQIIRTLLKRFIEIDKEFIEGVIESGRSFKIIKLEGKFERLIEFTIRGEVIKVNLRGFADRVDMVGDKTRIIDYKTGKVDRLSKVDVASVFIDSKRSKALQLLMYRAMYDDFNDPNLEGGIVGFRDLTKYVQSVSILKEQQADIKNIFYDGLKDLIESMLYDDSEIVHDPKSTWCNFCELH